MVLELSWTGGSEVEFVQTIDGTRYLIDWNPRYPAWIFGAIAAVDINLPLALVRAAALKLFGITLCSCEMQRKLESNQLISPTSTGYFVRTVIEQRNSGVQPVTTSGPNDSTLLSTSVCISSKGGGVGRPHPSRNTDAGKLLQQVESTGSPLSSGHRSPNLVRSRQLLSVDRLEQGLAANQRSTPLIFLDHQAIRSAISRMKETVNTCLSECNKQVSMSLMVEFALSIKTNPSPDVLSTALGEGMISEAISLIEVRAALAAGFPAKDIILNGPGKWFDHIGTEKKLSISLRAVIADSAMELDRLTQAVVSGRILNDAYTSQLAIEGAEFIGVRLAIPGTGSRFGADTSNSSVLRQLAASLQRLPAKQKTVFHFHFASSTLGVPAWTTAVKAAMSAARTIDRMATRDCSMLDFGGGWAHNTFTDPSAVKSLTDIFSTAIKNFPALTRVVFEPGKALVQSAGTLVTRVLSVRESSIQLRESRSNSDDDDSTDKANDRIAVLDTSIAELPDILSHDHAMAWLSQNYNNCSVWQPMSASGGTDALYGRICMEHDVLAGSIKLPTDLRAGDFISISSMGAYDVSMAYRFGAAASSVLPMYQLNV